MASQPPADDAGDEQDDQRDGDEHGQCPEHHEGQADEEPTSCQATKVFEVRHRIPCLSVLENTEIDAGISVRG